MALRRMDNVEIVVEDLAAAVAFFRELGMELEGQATMAESWAARLVGLEHMRVDIAMMRTPDGHGRLELVKFQEPKAQRVEPQPINTLGIRRLMFAVDDLDEVVTRLRAHGAEPFGETVQYEDKFRLCYLRGPEGIMIALAQQLKP